MAYATRTQLKARLSITGTSDDAILDDALEWAQKWIDSYCDRWFEAVTATRYYDRSCLDPDNRRRLLVEEDLLTITTLKNGNTAQTTLASTTYWLEPRNTTPKVSILLKSDYAWEFDTDGWVEVTGTWGWSAVADGLIEGACLQLAEFHYRSKDLAETVTPFSEGSVTVKAPGFPRSVLTDLAPRRRLR